MSSVREKVVRIISEHLDVDEGQVKDNTRIIEDLAADSLDTAELVMEFEDEWDIDLNLEPNEALTVGEAVKKIEEILAKKKNASNVVHNDPLSQDPGRSSW